MQAPDLKSIISRISLGALCPSMQVIAVDSSTIDGVPVKRPGIVVVLKVEDADTQVQKTLCHTFVEPAKGFEDEAQAVEWVFEKVRSVLVHELQEFFRFDGTKLKPPPHSIEPRNLRCTDCGAEGTVTPCSCGARPCVICRSSYHSGTMRVGCASFTGKKLAEEVFGTRGR